MSPAWKSIVLWRTSLPGVLTWLEKRLVSRRLALRIEEPAGDGLTAVGAGHEKVGKWLADIDGPGRVLVSRARGEVESEGGERVLEHLVALGLVPDPVLKQVEVVVLVELAETGARCQSVSAADEVTAHLDGYPRIIPWLIFFLFPPEAPFFFRLLKNYPEMPDPSPGIGRGRFLRVGRARAAQVSAAVAMPRTSRNPHMSVQVVRIGLEARAGSAPKRLRASGMMPPRVTETSVLMARARADDEGEGEVLLPEEGDQPENEPERQPVEDTNHRFLCQHPQVIALSKDAEREFADAHGNCLISGASAHVRNDGQEDGEGDDGLQGILEESNHAGGDKVERNVGQKPADAFP